MSVRTMVLGAFVLTLPVVVEVPTSPDSGRGGAGDTRITLVGGLGRYAIIDRGCEGQVLRTHPTSFRDAGGEIEHRLSNGLAAGVRGGMLHQRTVSRFMVTDQSVYPYRESLAVVVSESDNAYVNPFVAIEGQRVGLGVGQIWARRTLPVLDSRQEMSFHLRIGNPNRMYFKASYMENSPLYSGGGYVDLGFGGRPHPRWDIIYGPQRWPVRPRGAQPQV